MNAILRSLIDEELSSFEYSYDRKEHMYRKNLIFPDEISVTVWYELKWI